VQCEATERRDHGRIEPRLFSIRHTELISPSNQCELIMPSSTALKFRRIHAILHWPSCDVRIPGS